MQTIRILFLEDNLKTLTALVDELAAWEELLINQPVTKYVAVTVLSEYTQVQEYINSSDKVDYDIILLDRDCKAGGSFHVLDIEKFSRGKIIAISSNPEWNKEAQQRGVDKVVLKNYYDLKFFAEEVIDLIKKMAAG
jgi:hypothetical protein